MIQLQELTKSFGDRVLFDHVTWQITDRERVGLCGPNGAGKTTLLRMMAGFDEPDSGAILRPAALTVGYLPQDGLTHAGRTLFEEASSAFDELLAMKAEMHALEERLGDPSIPEPEHDAMLHRYSDLQDRFRLHDGYSIELKTATVLQGLGFKPADVEEYLNAYPHAVILVSHDRFFLDAVVTRIADLTLRTLTDYIGNYSHYLAEHEARIEALRKAKREQDEEVARVKMFIDRFRYQATKASQVQSRIKMLEKVVPIEVPPERKKIHFDFPACAKSGRTVLELKHARKAYGDLTVLADVTLHIERGDRIALVGPNGVGKSTLMRLLSAEEAPDSGQRSLGHNVVMQYFAQDEATRIDPAPTVYETLASGSPLQMVPMIRNILGGFLFTGDDVYKRVRVLSGGERTRLAVARMLLRPSNTLLLDEPTNHLDLDSKEVLLDALVDYGGTLIFVSHDRYFVERLATKIIEVGNGAAIVYPGTYKEFLWHKEHPSAPHAVPKTPARAAAPKPKTQAPQPSRDEKKRVDAEARKRQRAAQAHQQRIDQLEARIAECEAAIRELEQTMAAPGFYDDRAAAQPVIDRHQALMWKVGDLMHQWEELQSTPDVAAEA
jgi:ATP-binding cassette subfamily F protein 3